MSPEILTHSMFPCVMPIPAGVQLSLPLGGHGRSCSAESVRPERDVHSSSRRCTARCGRSLLVGGPISCYRGGLARSRNATDLSSHLYHLVGAHARWASLMGILGLCRPTLSAMKGRLARLGPDHGSRGSWPAWMRLRSYDKRFRAGHDRASSGRWRHPDLALRSR